MTVIESGCFQLRRKRGTTVKVRRERKSFKAKLSEISCDRMVLVVPTAVEIGEEIALELTSHKPEYELIAIGRVLWSRVAAQGEWRVVCELTQELSPDLLEALSSEGLLEPRQPSTYRFPVEATAQWEMDPHKLHGTVEAFSPDGFEFLAGEQPKKGERLLLMLSRPGEELQIPARACQQIPLSQGYLMHCTFETARGYEQLGQFVYPPDAEPQQRGIQLFGISLGG